MERVETRGRMVEIPGCPEELRGEQYEYFCFLSSALLGGMISGDQFRVRWMSYLLGMRGDFTLLLPEYVGEIEGQMGKLSGFFVADGEGREWPRLESARNLLPEYRGFQGPGDMLRGLSFGAFMDLSAMAEELADVGPEETAEICRGMARRMYGIPEGERVPELLAFHAPRFFGAVWRAIQSGPLEINGRRIDFRIIFRSAGEHRGDDGTGWTGVAMEVAGAGVFGSLQGVKDAEMWEVMMYLYKCKFEYMEDKRRRRAYD